MNCCCIKVARMTVLFFTLIFSLSCNHDSDLLADYIRSDRSITDHTLANDFFIVRPDRPSVLDVLLNDGYETNDVVKIIETSTPVNGSVEINTDNSITYTPPTLSQTGQDVQTEQAPQPEQTPNTTVATSTQDSITDTFTYTTEVLSEDETVILETGSVEITIAAQEDNNLEGVPTQEAENTGNTTAAPVASPPSTDGSISAKLLFKSGFDGISLSSPTDGYQYLQGIDSKTGYGWPIGILGSDFGGIHRVNDDGGPAIDNRIETVAGPSGSQSVALFQRVNYDVQVTQTPYQINNIKQNPKELYMSYWMKTDDTSVKGIDKWRAIWEYKTDNYASNKNGFRMIAFMGTDYEGKPYWLFQGDTSPQDPVWQKQNRTVPLLMNEWFKVEYHIKWSDGADGYASMRVNGHLIGEHYGATTSNSDDLDFIMLTQVYGNSYPMHQWVDDIEIWDGIPPR